MVTTRMDFTSFVGKLLEQDDVDALHEGVKVLAQAVMETEVSSQIGAACRAQKPRIGPVTRSFLEFARPAPPRRPRWGDPDRPPGETPVS
jgi:hypothetical protein